jgi:hypothetical protein
MVMVKGVRSVELSGSVQLLYPRLPWHLWKQGWHRHRDGLGESCWIRFNWPECKLKSTRLVNGQEDSKI